MMDKMKNELRFGTIHGFGSPHTKILSIFLHEGLGSTFCLCQECCGTRFLGHPAAGMLLNLHFIFFLIFHTADMHGHVAKTELTEIN